MERERASGEIEGDRGRERGRWREGEREEGEIEGEKKGIGTNGIGTARNWSRIGIN